MLQQTRTPLDGQKDIVYNTHTHIHTSNLFSLLIFNIFISILQYYMLKRKKNSEMKCKHLKENGV